MIAWLVVAEAAAVEGCSAPGRPHRIEKTARARIRRTPDGRTRLRTKFSTAGFTHPRRCTRKALSPGRGTGGSHANAEIPPHSSPEPGIPGARSSVHDMDTGRHHLGAQQLADQPIDSPGAAAT